MMSFLLRRSPLPSAQALVVLALTACGGDGDIVPTEPEVEPEQPELPLEAVEGQAIFAIDNKNTLFLFGSENPGTIPHAVKIAGLPLLNRIVGIAVRPSTGELYGIGNDSRVYIIEPASGVATPVASNRFEPTIARVFDTHFGMAFDPETERIRLISSDSHVNWSIDPDDGTAVREGDPHYAAGDPNEGKRLEIATLAYVLCGVAQRCTPINDSGQSPRTRTHNDVLRLKAIVDKPSGPRVLGGRLRRAPEPIVDFGDSFAHVWHLFTYADECFERSSTGPLLRPDPESGCRARRDTVDARKGMPEIRSQCFLVTDAGVVRVDAWNELASEETMRKKGACLPSQRDLGHGYARRDLGVEEFE